MVNTNTHKQKLNWLFAILFLLFSTLAIEHQMDLDPPHHEHHHCELFYLIGSAISSYIVNLPIVLQGIISTIAFAMKPVSLDIIVSQARAPPPFTIIYKINQHE